MENQCSICHLSFSKWCFSNKKLDCGHKFHSECINYWLNEQSNCPLCRIVIEIPTDTKSCKCLVFPTNDKILPQGMPVTRNPFICLNISLRDICEYTCESILFIMKLVGTFIIVFLYYIIGKFIIVTLFDLFKNPTGMGETILYGILFFIAGVVSTLSCAFVLCSRQLAERS